jgi:hypothetical protein
MAKPFCSKIRNAPVPMATRFSSESCTFASVVAVRRVRWATRLWQVMRPSITAPRKWTFISMVAALTPTSATTERPIATAIEEMVAEAEQLGADAVIGVDVDYESIQIGQGGSMLMVSASGTAVKL